MEDLPQPWQSLVDVISSKLVKQMQGANKDRIRDIYRYTPFRLLSLASHLTSPPKLVEKIVRAFVCTPFGMKSMLQRCAQASVQRELGPDGDDRAEKLLKFLGDDSFKESVTILASTCFRPICSVYSSISVPKVLMQTKHALETLLDASKKPSNQPLQDDEYTDMARKSIQEIWGTLRTIASNPEPSCQATIRWLVNVTAAFQSNQFARSLDELANLEISSLGHEHSADLRRWLSADAEFEADMRSLQEKKRSLNRVLRCIRKDESDSGQLEDEPAILNQLEDLAERIEAMERPHSGLDAVIQSNLFRKARTLLIAALDAV